jgi:hypothetical protein
MEKWRNGDMETGDMIMETWTWRHGDIKQKTENECSGNFPYSVYCLLNLQMEVSCLVDEEQTEVVCLKID